jgi:hypothetical protein
MKITVWYNARDKYNIPDEKWREAMALCGNDEDSAFDILMGEGLEEFLYSGDVTDRYIEAEEQNEQGSDTENTE